MNSRVRDIHKEKAKFRMVAVTKPLPICIAAIILLAEDTAFMLYDAKIVLPSLIWVRSDHANYHLHAI